MDGNLLATTVTASYDINQDGAIDPFTESGLYWFTDKEAHEDGNVESFQAGIYLVSEVLPRRLEPDATGSWVRASARFGDFGQAQVYNFGGDDILAYTLALELGTVPEDVDIATNVDFGNIELSTVSGFKFEDVNGNGVRDPGEPGLPGWDIYLYLSDISDVRMTTTDVNGEFHFENIQPNESPVQWYLIEVLKPGWGQTFPSAGYYRSTSASRKRMKGSISAMSSWASSAGRNGKI